MTLLQTATDYTITGALVAVILGLLEVIKYYIGKKKSDKNPGPEPVLPALQAECTRLRELTNLVREDIEELKDAITKIEDRTLANKQKLSTYLEKKTVLTDEERNWLRRLFEAHDVKDENGVPLWYVPRFLITILERIVTRLEAQATTSNNQTQLLELMLSQLSQKGAGHD